MKMTLGPLIKTATCSHLDPSWLRLHGPAKCDVCGYVDKAGNRIEPISGRRLAQLEPSLDQSPPSGHGLPQSPDHPHEESAVERLEREWSERKAALERLDRELNSGRRQPGVWEQLLDAVNRGMKTVGVFIGSWMFAAVVWVVFAVTGHTMSGDDVMAFVALCGPISVLWAWIGSGFGTDPDCSWTLLKT